MLKKVQLKTSKRCEFIDITSEVTSFINEAGIESGTVAVFCPHTTAGITINENADPDVQRDMLLKTSELVPEIDSRYKHGEGNSDSHIKSSLYGASETIIIEKGNLLLGTWQGIYFAEFDGPRTRTCFIKIQGDK